MNRLSFSIGASFTPATEFAVTPLHVGRLQSVKTKEVIRRRITSFDPVRKQSELRGV